MKKIKRALISVWDKNNLDEFAKFLISKDIQKELVVMSNLFLA